MIMHVYYNVTRAYNPNAVHGNVTSSNKFSRFTCLKTNITFVDSQLLSEPMVFLSILQSNVVIAYEIIYQSYLEPIRGHSRYRHKIARMIRREFIFGENSVYIVLQRFFSVLLLFPSANSQN